MPDAAAGIIPAGTVVAYAGIVAGESLDANPPAPIVVIEGWFLCNGAELPIAGQEQLFNAIGHAHGGSGVNFRLPDYRGFFLRGVDRGAGRDPDTSGRLAPHAGGNGGNRVGSVQQDATGTPRNPFRTDPHLGHSHGDPTWNGVEGDQFELATLNRAAGGFDYGSQSAPTTVAGAHEHRIVGGDQETRPRNVYVHYLIKA